MPKQSWLRCPVGAPGEISFCLNTDCADEADVSDHSWSASPRAVVRKSWSTATASRREGWYWGPARLAPAIRMPAVYGRAILVIARFLPTLLRLPSGRRITVGIASDRQGGLSYRVLLNGGRPCRYRWVMAEDGRSTLSIAALLSPLSFLRSHHANSRCSTWRSTLVMSGRKKSATVQSSTIRKRRSQRGIWKR